MKGKSATRFFDDMGLCFVGGWAMGYGHEHGALRWAPSWVKHSICHVWNKVHCFLAGHDSFGYEAYKHHAVPGAPVCSNCCARLKIDGRYPTPEEIKAHNKICYKNWEEAEAKWRLEHPEEAAENDRLIAEMDDDPEDSQ